MKAYLTEIIPKIQRFSKKLDDLTTLTNQHWVVIDELRTSKSIYIFRSTGELLISLNGKVEKAKWEYLGNNSLLIDKLNESYLFKHGFIDSNVIALKVDSKNEYVFLVNENKYEGELNSIENIIDFLRKEYLETETSKHLREKLGIKAEAVGVVSNDKSNSPEPSIEEIDPVLKGLFWFLVVLIIVALLLTFLTN